MGILIKQRKIGISVGMNEYQRMCVFMVRAKEKEKKNKREKEKKRKDGENKSTGNKSNWAPLSSSPKRKERDLLHVPTHEVRDFLTKLTLSLGGEQNGKNHHKQGHRVS